MPAPTTTWALTFYGANEDPNVSPYDTLAVSSINGYTGATSTTVYILAPEAKWEFEHFNFTDVAGSQSQRSQRRRVFNVETQPYEYGASSNPDLDDIDTLTSIIDTKKFLWVRIEAGSRTYPSASNVAHPVVVSDWQENIAREYGTRRIQMTLQHRFRT